MSERPAVVHLEQLLGSCKLIVAVGSGGVGKTTTAAALAIAAARRGRRCAVLTIDPARRLAQALGVARLGNEPQALAADVVAPGSVDAMMLEAPDALDRLIERMVPDPARRERLFANRLYQVIARHLGGTHEYMAVERLYSLVREHDYDLVVLDTPPTVNALDFLDAPGRIAAFFSDKITRFFQRKHDENRGLIQRIRDRAGEVALQVLGKALGEDFIEELIDFVTAFGGLFAAFQERGVVAEKLLRDPSCAFVVVTGADPVRVAEAEELAKTLSRLDLEARCFVANRVHVSPSADARPRLTVVDVERALAGFAAQADVSALTEGMTRAVEIRAALARRDRAGLARLAELAGKQRLLVVPELDDEVGDRSAIDHLIAAMFDAR